MKHTRRELLACLPGISHAAAAVSGVVRIERRGKHWSMSNGSVRIAGSTGPAGVQLQSLQNVATGFEWVIAESASGAGISIGPYQWLSTESPAFSFQRSSVRELPTGAVHQSEVWDQKDTGARVLLERTCFPGAAVVEFRCRMANPAATILREVKRFDPVVLRLRGDAGPLRIHTIDRTNYTLKSTELAQSFEARGGDWNRPWHAGWLAIENTRAEETLFLGIEWERDWVMRLERSGREIALSAGLIHVSRDLGPGEAIDSPRIFVGLVSGDLDRAARETQDYLKRFIFPKALPNFPWAIYHVYSTGPENEEEIILRELDKAVWLGADMFHHDASWYVGSSIAGTGDWGAGLGSYVEHSQKFPRGLARVSREVHRRGMKFGLWVDPVVVDSRRVGKSIPESWLASFHGQPNGLTIKTWEAPVRQLCVANPEVKEHLKKELASMVERYEVNWIKWDNSALGSYPYCDRKDHGHQAGDGSYSNAMALYDIWAYLHERFPNLVLEQCGFGSRLDFGLARYQRANWLTDALAGGKDNLASLARSTVLTAAYVYPSSYNLSGVALGSEIDTPAAPMVLDSVFRSRMMGLFRVATPRGDISSRFSQWRPDVQEAARRNLVNFRAYRHLLSEDLYHLTPDSSEQDWTVAEFCSRDGEEAVVFCFRGHSDATTRQLQLKGLLPGSYSVKSYNSQTVQQQDGTAPVTLELGGVETSEILHFRRATRETARL